MFRNSQCVRVFCANHVKFIAPKKMLFSTQTPGVHTVLLLPGAEPMGLFWSMRPSPGQRLGIRFLIRDATKPAMVKLFLYGGHLDMRTLQTAEPEATTVTERRYMGEDVERITVHSGSLRGSLFKPKGIF